MWETKKGLCFGSPDAFLTFLPVFMLCCWQLNWIISDLQLGYTAGRTENLLKSSILQNIHKRAVKLSIILHQNSDLKFSIYFHKLALVSFPRKQYIAVTFITKKAGSFQIQLKHLSALYLHFVSIQYSTYIINTFNTVRNQNRF